MMCIGTRHQPRQITGKLIDLGVCHQLTEVWIRTIIPSGNVADNCFRLFQSSLLDQPARAFRNKPRAAN